MNTKSLVLLLVAGGCGLVASVAATRHLSGKQTTEPTVTIKHVVVAAEDIAVGTELTKELLTLKAFPADAVAEGAFADLKSVLGKRAKMDLFAGEPILEQKLGTDLTELSRRLPRGMRAATVRVDEADARLAGLIKPGDHVDVIWLYNDPESGDAMIKTLLQDIEVLAVGQDVDPETKKPDKEGSYDRSETDRNYTLLVTPQQNNVLALASSKGKIRLALRGKSDGKIVPDAEIGLSSLLPQPKNTDEQADQEPEIEREVVVEYIRKGEVVRQPYKIGASKN